MGMTKLTPPKKKDAIVHAALNKATQLEKRIVRKHGGKVTNEEYKQALMDIATGHTMAKVTAELGIGRAALLIRAIEDAEFAAMLKNAQRLGAYSQLEMAENALWAGDLSTGDTARDKAIAEHLRWKASRILRDQFGDKLEIEQKTFSIIVQATDQDRFG